MKAVFIIGPSGSGKTTLSNHIQELYGSIFGSNFTISINLDCANQNNKQIDICNLIHLEDIMDQYQLGPNGSLLYAMDFLQQNIEWLYHQIDTLLTKKHSVFTIINNKSASDKLSLDKLQTSNILLIFDLPGQTQLYLNHDSLRHIIDKLIERYQLKSCLLQLFDATYIYKVSDFVSMCMMSLTTTFNLNLPHISLLNKIDLLKGQRPADGMLEGYLGLASLKQLVSDHLSYGQNQQILQSIAHVVDDYGQVTFLPCSIYKPQLLIYLLLQLEKCFQTFQANLVSNQLFSKAVSQHLEDLGGKKLLINLEAELFSQQQQIDFEAELIKMRLRTQKQKINN